MVEAAAHGVVGTAQFPAVSKVDPSAAEQEAAIAQMAEKGEWENAMKMLQATRRVFACLSKRAGLGGEERVHVEQLSLLFRL